MKPNAHEADASNPDGFAKPGWVATFMILDVGGSISSSHLERLAAPIRKLVHKLFRK